MPSNKNLPVEILETILKAQKCEITEHKLYSRLASCLKDENNARTLRTIAEDELRHYNFWYSITGKKPSPNRLRIFVFFLISRILGITFGIKLMEKGEARAKLDYSGMVQYIPEAEKIAREEEAHENKLISLIHEEFLNYIGSIVLGLNDALIELTGALAGLSFAFQKTRLIALAGLITGIAASFSMAASEYLSTRAEGNDERALRSSIYTGITYIITVVLLILPYLLFKNYLLSLGVTLAVAILIIFFFNFYISVAKDYSFKDRFIEMAGLSLGIAGISFGIGYLIRIFWGVDI